MLRAKTFLGLVCGSKNLLSCFMFDCRFKVRKKLFHGTSFDIVNLQGTDILVVLFDAHY